MDQTLQDHWTNIIKPLFKDTASFEVRFFGGINNKFEFKISWIINTDQSRQNKPSKTLRIIFPWETIEDYQNKPESWQKNADKKIVQFINRNLENFEPDHDNPRSMPPPMVEWIITTNVLY